MKDLAKEIELLKQRNARVEADKEWEISLTRRSVIALGTYVFSAILFVLIKAADPFLAALVPTCAYVLSTLTLPFFKKLWKRQRK